MEFRDMAVVVTAYRRPQYLEETLKSWAQVVAVRDVGRFMVALGHSDRKRSQLSLVAKMQAEFPTPIDVVLDTPEASVAVGVNRALGEAAIRAFVSSPCKFTVFGEEDVVVSDDVLEYMRWAAHRFEQDRQVVIACAHNRGGCGWDTHEPPRDADADQAAVRLLPYFNPWCWGTWQDRWHDVLRPWWDWDCNSGGRNDSGYDWNIQKRILPRVGGLCTVPDAARSQTIGRYEGWASNEYSWSFSQSQSFREIRGSTNYRLVG
jgi:hypothetical protein